MAPPQPSKRRLPSRLRPNSLRSDGEDRGRPRRRGQLAAIVALSVGAVAVASVALWRPAQENWYLHRLASEDRLTHNLAADRLGEIRLRRAVGPPNGAIQSSVRGFNEGRRS